MPLLSGSEPLTESRISGGGAGGGDGGGGVGGVGGAGGGNGVGGGGAGLGGGGGGGGGDGGWAVQYSQSPAQRFCGGVVPASTWSERQRLIALPRPSYSGSVFMQSPFDSSPSVASSSYVVQTQATALSVQSTHPAGGFFGRALPPIFANSSSFEPGHAGPSQNSISEIGPQCLLHDLRHLPWNFRLAHLAGFFSTHLAHLAFRLPEGGSGVHLRDLFDGRRVVGGRRGARQHEVFFGLHFASVGAASASASSAANASFISRELSDTRPLTRPSDFLQRS